MNKTAQFEQLAAGDRKLKSSKRISPVEPVTQKERYFAAFTRRTLGCRLRDGDLNVAMIGEENQIAPQVGASSGSYQYRAPSGTSNGTIDNAQPATTAPALGTPPPSGSGPLN